MGGARQTVLRAAPVADELVTDPCGCALCAAMVRRRHPLDLVPGNLDVARCHACGHFVPRDVLTDMRVGRFGREYLLCGLCAPCPTCGRCAPDELVWYADWKGTVRTCHRCEPLPAREVCMVTEARWNPDPATSPGWLCRGIDYDENGVEREVDVGPTGEAL